MVPMHFSKLSVLRHTEVCTLSKIPSFTQNSSQAFSTYCCNAFTSFIGTEYTNLFRCPTATNPNHQGPLTGPPCHILCSSKGWFRCCLIMHRKWGGTPFFTKKRWYTAPICLLDKTANPKNWYTYDAHPGIDLWKLPIATDSVGNSHSNG
jgi:hypothetical protein